MLNNKEHIRWIIVLLVLCMLIGGIFSFKTLNDRIASLSRNNTIYKDYFDLAVGNMKESFILRNKKIKLDDVLISENGDTLQLDNVVDKNNTMIFLSSSLGCNECTLIQLQIVDELNHSKDANVIIIFNKQSQREISLYKRMNKIRSTIYISYFDKNINDMLLGGPLLLKMDKEFSVIDIFRPIKQLPELTRHYIQTVGF
jgi:hypothetical protein